MESLAIEDARAIVRLLGDLIADVGSIADRRRRLLRELAKLVDADVWIWVHSRGFAPGANAVPFAVLDGGYASEEQKALVLECMTSAEGTRMVSDPLAAEIRRVGHLTRTRDDLVADDVWYGSEVYRTFRAPSGLDDMILSVYPLSEDSISAIGLHRRVEAGPFRDRERCIAHLVTSEIDWLHRAGTDVPAAEGRGTLTPRQNQILLLLLAGDSPKQIARKLRLSVHTVNDHMKVLHRHFNASSRGELLSRFVSGGGGR